MFAETVTLTIAALAPRVDACELCGVKPEALATSVVIRHARGGTIQFAACTRCTSAMRRLIAAAGGATTRGQARLTLVSEDPQQSTLPAESSAPDLVGEPALLFEFAELFSTEDDQQYAVRVFGQERADGTWIGWLTFATPDGRTVRNTPRETTQSNREQVAYWASGLEASYLQGAFRRTSW